MNTNGNTRVPRVDVFGNDNGYLLLVDLPGIDKSAIDLKVDDGVLSLLTEQPTETDADEQPAYLRHEHWPSNVARRFRVPDDIDADAISATSTNGVLHITLPKLAKVQPKQISVQVS